MPMLMGAAGWERRSIWASLSRALARLVREHWSVEAHHHARDVTFGEDTAAVLQEALPGTADHHRPAD